MKLFGTDGVRGLANVGSMSPDSVLKLAMAAAKHFMKNHKTDHKFSVVIGKDTRLSGYMVENALVSGFVSMGANVFLLGPLPTPAVAMLTRSLRADLGVMVSASHNKYFDNGIKLFNSKSLKISSSDEKSIEEIFQTNDFCPPTGTHLGRAKRLEDACGRYIEFAKATFEKGIRLDGFKIVLDCANGATYKVAPRVLWELGAEVITIGTDPNGININENCGATDTLLLRNKVLEHKACIGIALDGDGDRLIMVDSNGCEITGDHIIALVATLLKEIGLLKGDGVVGTVMCNLGLERYLNAIGLKLYRSSVGDRNVLDLMNQEVCNIGGEPSGHIILSDYSTTGDGLIAALQVLSLMIRKNIKSIDILRLFPLVPQLIKNISMDHFVDSDKIQIAIDNAKQKIGNNGSVLVRASGTEPVLRLMAQSDDEGLLNVVMNDLMISIKAC